MITCYALSNKVGVRLGWRVCSDVKKPSIILTVRQVNYIAHRQSRLGPGNNPVLRRSPEHGCRFFCMLDVTQKHYEISRALLFCWIKCFYDSTEGAFHPPPIMTSRLIFQNLFPFKRKAHRVKITVWMLLFVHFAFILTDSNVLLSTSLIFSPGDVISTSLRFSSLCDILICSVHT